jgi:hypothetical protein
MGIAFAVSIRDLIILIFGPYQGARVALRVECDPDAFNDILTYAYTGKVRGS